MSAGSMTQSLSCGGVALPGSLANEHGFRFFGFLASRLVAWFQLTLSSRYLYIWETLLPCRWCHDRVLPRSAGCFHSFRA